MRLTRAQMRGDIRHLEAQRKIDRAVLATALAEVARLSDPDGNRLLRALHHNEFLEADNQRLQAELDDVHSRLADLAVEHPHAFPKEAS